MSPSGRSLVLCCVCGLFFTLDLWFWHRSIHYIGPGLATRLANFQVFFLTLVGIALFQEKPTWRFIAAVPLAFLGLCMIVGLDFGELALEYRIGLVFGLLTALCDAGYSVSLETSGALDIAEVDERVSRVVDVKTPGSGEAKRNLWENVSLLTPRDQVKFVVCDRRDFDWALERVDMHGLAERCPVLFSPSWGQVEQGELADWILEARSPVRLQLQLHKVLWGDVPGR